ncbi:MAG: hypothetical protein IJ328_05215 [Muribaculaceae bacterium]|nr:hypothetical protein [Muribaculaceae bacterium]
MKMIKNILILILAVFAVSCVEKEPDYQNFPGKDVDFSFSVDGDEYAVDYYYVSTIKFVNTSEKKGNVTWDFASNINHTNGKIKDAEGNDKVVYEILDDSEPDVVKVKYAGSGNYTVALTVDGYGTRTYPVQIMDISPSLNIVEQSTDTVVIGETQITMGVAIPNPDNLQCAFTWVMPEGTTLADGTPIETYEGRIDENGNITTPGALKFKNVGSNKITLRTVFDVPTAERPEGTAENRRLADSYVNVQVGFTEEVPTLYYASYGGNIKALKLIPEGNLPEGSKNLPFDMGVSSGVTPQSIVFAPTKDGDFIFLLDCGKKFTYQNDTDGVLGDGKITVMSADGTYANTVITNVGGHAFSDPFHGCVRDNDGDGYADDLLYTDRNNGVSSIAVTERGKVETRLQATTSSYNVVNNATLGYYGRGIAYGAVHSAIALDSKGVYYWPKSYNAAGVFRFRQSDIGVTDKIPCPILLDGALPKAFAIDETKKHMYIWSTGGGGVEEGFVQYPLVDFEGTLKATEYTKYVKMDVAETSGSSVEALLVSQFAVHSATGNVYFGFNPDGDTTRPTAGIYYFDYAASDVTKTPLVGTEGDKVFGICINPRGTKLF